MPKLNAKTKLVKEISKLMTQLVKKKNKALEEFNQLNKQIMKLQGLLKDVGEAPFVEKAIIKKVRVKKVKEDNWSFDTESDILDFIKFTIKSDTLRTNEIRRRLIDKGAKNIPNLVPLLKQVAVRSGPYWLPKINNSKKDPFTLDNEKSVYVRAKAHSTTRKKQAVLVGDDLA